MGQSRRFCHVRTVSAVALKADNRSDVARAFREEGEYRSLLVALCEREKPVRMSWATRTRELADANAKLQSLNRSLAEASLVDPLTGLRNRRFMPQHMPRLVAARGFADADDIASILHHRLARATARPGGAGRARKAPRFIAGLIPAARRSGIISSCPDCCPNSAP